MSSPSIARTLDEWVLQAVSASRFLTKLYRALGDERQAFTVIRAGSIAENYCAKQRFSGKFPAVLKTDHGDPAQVAADEEAAWKQLLEALAGLCAVFAMVDWSRETATGMAGSRTAASAAFRQALRGYLTAFPDTMVREGVAQSLEAATASICTRTFKLQSEDPTPSPECDRLRQELRKFIQESLAALANRPASARRATPQLPQAKPAHDPGTLSQNGNGAPGRYQPEFCV
jgi:hypothetical protein